MAATAVMHVVRERLPLVATNSMRIAGIQGVYGDPCGIDIVPISPADALFLEPATTLLVDSGSVSRLFDLLYNFRDNHPKLRLLVIGMDADETFIECVIGAGAKGFIGGNADATEFRTALENVRDGSIWAPRKILARMVQTQLGGRFGGDNAAQARFTPREHQIIQLLISGQSNRDIGNELGIDPVTVKAHMGRIMRKANVVNRVELTIYALNRKAAMGFGGLPLRSSWNLKLPDITVLPLPEEPSVN